MDSFIDLKGKTALITGATRGIGKAIADDFIEIGANVLLTGTNKENIDLLNSENKNSKIEWIAGDFTNYDRMELFLSELEKYNDIDICVNNAGINIIKPFEEYSDNDYQRLLSINLKAPFSIIKQLLPNMKKKGWGRIVNIASIWSHISKPGRTLYSTSKTGLEGLTRSIAIEYASSNILANAVSPGFTLTELTKKSLSTEEINDLSNQIPLKRFAKPEEISKTVLFLCSNMNSYITGQNIIVDGGFTLV